MASTLGWRRALFFGLAFSSLLSAFVNVGSNEKQDRSWKRYRNSSLGYCVSYPGRWYRGDAFDGAGLFVETGNTKFSRPSGAIDFGVLSTPLKDARAVPVSLVQDLADHLEGLQKFERAERMEVLEKREMKFQGHAALFTKNRYYDPQERATWIEEVLFVNSNDSLYRLELQCRAGEIDRFEPVFVHLLSTFQFDCQ
jgi:hypothetical protein